MGKHCLSLTAGQHVYLNRHITCCLQLRCCMANVSRGATASMRGKQALSACCTCPDVCACAVQPRGINVQPTLIAIVPADLQVAPQGVEIAPFGIAASNGK